MSYLTTIVWALRRVYTRNAIRLSPIIAGDIAIDRVVYTRACAAASRFNSARARLIMIIIIITVRRNALISHVRSNAESV